MIETALVKVTNDLFTASDVGLISILVLLDLCATFDTISHHILLQRMEHEIGILGSALRWFKSTYLIDVILLTFMMNHQDMSRLVMESHKVLCLDHYYLLYIWLP